MTVCFTSLSSLYGYWGTAEALVDFVRPASIPSGEGDSSQGQLIAHSLPS